MRRAIAHCVSQLPVATMSTRSASISSGENVRAPAAPPRADRVDSAGRSRPAPRRCAQNTSAIAWRTSGERIVEQHQQRAFGGGAIVVGQIGNQPGPRQRPRRLGPLARGSGADPIDELPNDHGSAGLRNLRRHRDAMPLSYKINHDA